MPSKLSQRDADVLRHLLKYCKELDDTFAFFGYNEELFKSNFIFRNAVSMPIQQIGELAKHLTDDFLKAHPEIPWKQVKGMREWFAHQYMDMNLHVIWITGTVDIPPLKSFCEKILSESE